MTDDKDLSLAPAKIVIVIILTSIIALVAGMFIVGNKSDREYDKHRAEEAIRADERLKSSTYYSARSRAYIIDCIEGQEYIIMHTYNKTIGELFIGAAATGKPCELNQFQIDNGIQ